MLIFLWATPTGYLLFSSAAIVIMLFILFFFIIYKFDAAFWFPRNNPPLPPTDGIISVMWSVKS